MKALVIGGTGFIGLNVVDALLAAGVDVAVTRRRRSITAYLRKRPVELRSASLEDEDALVAAMQDCDVVFHTAGYYPRYSLDRAASLAEAEEGIDRVCRAVLRAGVRRLVYTSSTGSLGPARGSQADEQDIPSQAPEESIYRAVKWQMERRLEFYRLRGLKAVTLLPGACLGPWDVRCGTGALLVGTVAGGLNWWVDGIVNPVDVRDVALAHVAAVDAPGDRYCLVGHNTTLSEMLSSICERYGGTMPKALADPNMARERARLEEEEAARTRSRAPFPRELVDLILAGQPIRSTRAVEDLGVSFRPLEETLDSAYQWFVKYRYLPAKGGERRSA